MALAEKKANNSPEFGMQLGMDPKCVRVWWKGVQGMTWDQLVPQLHQLKLTWPRPDMLIIHLGGNDINRTAREELLSTMKNSLNSVRYILPDCLMVWSDILPRRYWKQGTTLVEDLDKTVDRNRELINSKMHTIIDELGGTAVTHENIGPELYRPDGIHLSGRGIDTFNKNMQDFLVKWKEEFCQESSTS